MPAYSTIELQEDPRRGLATVLLARPELRNAFNPQMIAELTDCFGELAGRPAAELRTVVLTGKGDFFCSGGDLGWMRSMATQDYEANLADARRLADVLAAVDACPVPLVAAVRGGAFGGGLGLLCCCDIVLAEEGCSFSFSEVRLGIAPATIAPYVLARLQPAAARRLLLRAARFDGAVAREAGLVHLLSAADKLDEALEHEVRGLLSCGPLALRETKQLLRDIAGSSVDAAMRERTAELIARLRVSAEGQEGLSAFLEKRKAAWVIAD